jgi:hypothetical protein
MFRRIVDSRRVIGFIIIVGLGIIGRIFIFKNTKTIAPRIKNKIPTVINKMVVLVIKDISVLNAK